MKKVKICVPTMNAADLWPEFRTRLREQGILPDSILILDSESIDETPELARKEGFRVVNIARKDFRHGATRQRGVELLSDADVIVFLTQDAMLATSDAVLKLVAQFDDPKVGAAYGRQFPRKGAGLVEAHARTFNYPPSSAVRTLEDAGTLGFKAIFFSNSFGAYRRSALQSVGGFPLDVNFGEDTVSAARLLLAGWKVAYAADAGVYHSHAYSILDECKRYVEIGKLHREQAWLLERFGGVRGEGVRFIRSQLNFLWGKSPREIPLALVRAIAKLAGYRVGRLRK